MIQNKQVTVFWILFALFAGVGISGTLLNDRSPADPVIADRVSGNIVALMDHISRQADIVDPTGRDESELLGNLRKALPGEQGVTWLVYQDDELIYWSDNSIVAPDQIRFEAAEHESGLLDAGNGWYIPVSRSVEDLHIISLLRICSAYRVNNRFLQNEFNESLQVPAALQFSTDGSEGALPVSVGEGDPLFYLTIDPGRQVTFSNFTGAILLLLLFLMTHTVYHYFIKQTSRKDIGVVAGGCFILVITGLSKLAGWPDALHSMELFGPYHYASSALLSSLGDLLLFTCSLVLILSGLSQVLKKRLEIFIERAGGSYATYILFVTHFAVFVISMFLVSLASGLVMNSKISFNITNIYDLDLYSLLGVFIIGALIYGIIKLFDLTHAILSLVSVSRPLLTIIAAAVSGALLLSLVAATGPGGAIQTEVIIVFSVLFLIYLYSRNLLYRVDNLNRVLYTLVWFGILSVYIISHFNHLKELQTRNHIATRMINEHDLVAEYLFADLKEHIETDAWLAQIFQMPFNEVINSFSSQDYLENRLTRQYLTGYWNKYDIRIRTFYPDGVPLNALGDPTWNYGYFNGLVQGSNAEEVSEGMFYLRDDVNRVAYAGKMSIRLEGELSGIVYMTFRRKSDEDITGFPELLLSDEMMIGSEIDRQYSYAIYNEEGELVKHYGDYQYNVRVSAFGEPGEQGEGVFRQTSDGYSHFIISNHDELFIVSKEKRSLLFYITLFAYMFSFYGLMLLISRAVAGITSGKRFGAMDYKVRIQLTVISVTIISMILVGAGSMYFIINNHDKSTFSQADEKLRRLEATIREDLVVRSLDKLTLTDELNSRYSELSSLIGNDFNLFNESGELVFSSQPRIYELKLIGRLMNPVAYLNLGSEMVNSFFQYEQIGSLEYLSAYETLRKEDLEIIGFINLPYFAKEEELRNEVSGFLVAFINIYVLLLAASVVLALFISNRITKPLEVIQSKLSSIKYGARNEYIQWKSDDEIGRLVNEYNRMVSELMISAEQLARSERESAWREMAKQVAHEIKNPLTPMKLNVQHLERSLKSGREDIHEMTESLTRALTEQIDVLSNIATEFANFAKMPAPRNEPVDLLKVICSSVELHDKVDNITIEVDAGTLDKCIVFADNDQLARVFSNIIKNAVQAIGDRQEGRISISLKQKNGDFIVSVADNGTGIDKDTRGKIFTPNFTTKTGGSGLGLAMVKSIVENSGGRIWFESEQDKGSVFHISLPQFQ